MVLIYLMSICIGSSESWQIFFFRRKGEWPCLGCLPVSSSGGIMGVESRRSEMTIPDLIERGEARIERFIDRIQGDIYACSCGHECKLDEAEALSSDPYAEIFCPACIA